MLAETRILFSFAKQPSRARGSDRGTFVTGYQGRSPCLEYISKSST
jgi:hypothetical protein